MADGPVGAVGLADPCLQLVPVDWTVAEVVNNGRSVITLDHDRGGRAAMVVRLAPPATWPARPR